MEEKKIAATRHVWHGGHHVTESHCVGQQYIYKYKTDMGTGLHSAALPSFRKSLSDFLGIFTVDVFFWWNEDNPLKTRWQVASTKRIVKTSQSLTASCESTGAKSCRIASFVRLSKRGERERLETPGLSTRLPAHKSGITHRNRLFLFSRNHPPRQTMSTIDFIFIYLPRDRWSPPPTQLPS